MQKRKEILEFINQLITEEHGLSLKEDNLLEDSNLDSFGYFIFWTSLVEEYKIFKDDLQSLEENNKRFIKFTSSIDYKTYKVKDLISRIVKCL